MTTAASMAGKRILIVDDDFFNVERLAHHLRAMGAQVVGPAPSIADALNLLAVERLDGAVMDVSLRGETAYSVADALAERGVPFVLATGSSAGAIPERHATVPRYDKTAHPGALAAALFPLRQT